MTFRQAGTTEGPAASREGAIDSLMVSVSGVKWDDIVGLEEPKRHLMEMIIMPSLNPTVSPSEELLVGGPFEGFYESLVVFVSSSPASERLHWASSSLGRQVTARPTWRRQWPVSAKMPPSSALA